MPMYDGFKTLIVFSTIPNNQFAEVTVKPPGVSGRGPIDITSMRNSRFTTKWPKSLIDISSVTASVQWNPAFFTQILDRVTNKNQQTAVRFPNAQQVNFWGWADRFDPSEHREGEVPLATLEVIVSNMNNLGQEVAPTLVTEQNLVGG